MKRLEKDNNSVICTSHFEEEYIGVENRLL